jgi:hypothetical protein
MCIFCPLVPSDVLIKKLFDFRFSTRMLGDELVPRGALAFRSLKMISWVKKSISQESDETKIT